MHTAASIQWTPKEDVPYYNPEQNFVFKKGETYYGIPYTQFSRNNDLETFSTQLEMIDGVQYYVGPCEFDKYWGSDCSASLSNAWKQADPNFPSLLTRRMIPDRPKEIVPVGKYVLNFHDSTPDIVKENGFDVMKEAYALSNRQTRSLSTWTTTVTQCLSSATTMKMNGFSFLTKLVIQGMPKGATVINI